MARIASSLESLAAWSSQVTGTCSVHSCEEVYISLAKFAFTGFL